MASPAMTPRKPRTDCWAEFLWQAERQVHDCNIEAGENLWSVCRDDEESGRFTIASTSDPANRVECFFDAERSSVVCEAATGTFRFQLGRACPPERALAMTLDLLAEADAE